MDKYARHCQAIAGLYITWGDRDRADLTLTKVVKTLARIEKSLHKAHERACNEPYDARPVQKRARRAVAEMFPGMPKAILHIDVDPCECALKIDREFMRSHRDHIGLRELQTDYTGYGILSPDDL